MRRIFTSRELTITHGRMESLAARFAAKEAVAKTLGCGIGDVSWLDVEVLSGPNRQPELHLHGNAARIAEEQGLTQWAISLSHSQQFADRDGDRFGTVVDQKNGNSPQINTDEHGWGIDNSL